VHTGRRRALAGPTAVSSPISVSCARARRCPRRSPLAARPAPAARAPPPTRTPLRSMMPRVSCIRRVCHTLQSPHHAWRRALPSGATLRGSASGGQTFSAARKQPTDAAPPTHREAAHTAPRRRALPRCLPHTHAPERRTSPHRHRAIIATSHRNHRQSRSRCHPLPERLCHSPNPQPPSLLDARARTAATAGRLTAPSHAPTPANLAVSGPYRTVTEARDPAGALGLVRLVKLVRVGSIVSTVRSGRRFSSPMARCVLGAAVGFGGGGGALAPALSARPLIRA